MCVCEGSVVCVCVRYVYVCVQECLYGVCEVSVCVRECVEACVCEQYMSV